MLNPVWMLLSMVALVGGVLIILAPKLIMTLNSQLSKVLVSVDDLVLRYRHLVGAACLFIAYLCFRLALLVAAGL